MKIYRDQDADLSLLAGKTIAVIGYGNQGRAQALNLRDSGLAVLVGNRADSYSEQARQDGFAVFSLTEAARQGEVILLLIPDEILPAVFAQEIAPALEAGDTLVFASGYNIAFGYLQPPEDVDVVLVAPRMIGAGVRDLYQAGRGFPAFIGVAQDHSGQAQERALALAKGIGATKMGAVEVSFAQEAELDLFTEQCFGPAFGQVLMSAVNLLLDEGYPPEAVLLELYMSGEFSYTLAKIAELGMIEQTRLHSRTSQYGSISRGLRFMLPELRQRMAQGLEEIRSGEFAREWSAEQAAGCPTLESLQETARALPLYQFENELRAALGDTPDLGSFLASSTGAAPQHTKPGPIPKESWLERLLQRLTHRARTQPALPPLDATQASEIISRFLEYAAHDANLQEFAQDRQITSHYLLKDIELEFYLSFLDGEVTGGLGAPPETAQVRLETSAEVLDGMFSGSIDATRAALSGKIVFGGDTRLALGIQRIQGDLRHLYQKAREEVLGSKS
ncbi:MAG: ketol-acid reductoisomerase [Chloroflexota bacterium]